MTPEENIELIEKMYKKSEEEINEIFNTGVFNDICVGALVATMSNLGLDKKDIENCVWEMQMNTFGLYRASELLRIFREEKRNNSRAKNGA